MQLFLAYIPAKPWCNRDDGQHLTSFVLWSEIISLHQHVNISANCALPFRSLRFGSAVISRVHVNFKRSGITIKEHGSMNM